MHCVWEEFGRETPSSQPLSWKIWTRQKPMLQDSMPRKFGRRQTVQTSHFRSQMEQSKIVWKRSWNPKIHFNAGPTCKKRRAQWRPSRKFGRVSANRRSDGWQGSPQRFWVEGNYIDRQHVETRVQLCVPKEESFSFPLRFFVVVRTTHTCVARKLERWLM